MSGTNTSPPATARKRFDFAYSVRWNLFLITTGAILYSFAVKSIALPQQFIPGGLFGLGSLIYYKTGWLSPGIFFFLFNLPIFVLGWVKLSPRFVLYSLYAMVVTSVSFEFIQTTLDIHEQLYAAVACGVMSGLGGGLILRSLGSGGGLDIIAVWLFQNFNIGVGKVYFAFNAGLYLFCLTTMPIDLVIVSLIMVFISSAMVEHTLALFSKRKVVFIISDHSDSIAQAILDSMKQSATFLRGMGAFSKREKNVLMTVVNNIQLKKLEEITFTHDPHALFIVENTFSVLGSSFSRRKIY
jgi:uncharacterized membrane-anchored protein YitT (DUF2179 family)